MRVPGDSGRTAILACALAVPPVAWANVIWPPAVYFYMLSVWWVVISTLVVEFCVHFLLLRLPLQRLAGIVLLTNITSAAAGIVLAWPLVYWEPGVSRLATMAPASIVMVLVVIFAINFITEYFAAVRWLGVVRDRKSALSFLLANMVSYVVIIGIAMSGLASTD